MDENGCFYPLDERRGKDNADTEYVSITKTND
jgi:hypothetical protein